MIIDINTPVINSLKQPNDTKTRTILVVDDSAYVRRMIRFALPVDEYRIIESGDGTDALKCVECHSIDLLIADLKMPNSDGLTLIRELRQRPESKYLPIIMLTGKSSEDCRIAAREAGASAFIAKPFVPEQIAGLVKSIFT